jgi:hypothetical protein
VRAKEPWDILKEAPRRLDCFRDADDFPEEARSRTGESGPLSGNGEVLAGESSADQINMFMPVARPLPHVRPAGSVRKASGQDALAEWVAFDLIGDGESRESRSCESKVKSSYPGE